WLAGKAGAEHLGSLSGDEKPTGHTPDWVQFFAACEWLKEHSPPGSVVLSRKSTLVTVYSDRPSLLIPLIPPDKYPEFLRENNISYVLDDAFSWSVHTQTFLRPAISAYPQMFKRVDTTGLPITRVWEVVKTPPGG